MNMLIKYIGLGMCMLQLTSCDTMGERVNTDYPTYIYDPGQMYPVDNNRLNQYLTDYPGKPEVTVPDTYHVGANHSPVSFKDRDRQWIQGQSPQKYTIEVADGEKASQVAQQLYKVPKNDRMGQVQYQRDGKFYYKGLYGSYDSPEAAQKALDALPADVKQSAGVKSWGSVQGSLN